jgi:hypothetical protein
MRRTPQRCRPKSMPECDRSLSAIDQWAPAKTGARFRL